MGKHYTTEFKLQVLQPILKGKMSIREAARFLYEKLGFNEVDIRKNYYPKLDGGRENAVVMACYL